jgi:hypothetical protein
LWPLTSKKNSSINFPAILHSAARVDFIQAIIPHSERWGHIDFMLPIESLQLIGADFPLLRVLTLCPTHYAGGTDSLDAISPFSNAPLLKQVALSNDFGPFEIQLPWS